MASLSECTCNWLATLHHYVSRSERLQIGGAGCAGRVTDAVTLKEPETIVHHLLRTCHFRCICVYVLYEKSRDLSRLYVGKSTVPLAMLMLAC